MELKEEITTWLNDEKRDFLDGIRIAQRFLAQAFVSNLARIASQSNRDRLEYELRKHVNLPAPVAAKADPKKPEDKKPAVNQGELDELNTKLGSLVGDRAQLSNKLADLDGDELKATTLQINDLDKAIENVKAILEVARETGSLPSGQPAADQAELDRLDREWESSGQRLSRLKAKLKANPDHLPTRLDVERLEAERDVMRKQRAAMRQTLQAQTT